jgi:hypothetical protein
VAVAGFGVGEGRGSDVGCGVPVGATVAVGGTGVPAPAQDVRRIARVVLIGKTIRCSMDIPPF